MRITSIFCTTFLLLLTTIAAEASFRITEDRGGRIGTYVEKYEGLLSSGESVIIDGLCASACTIVLGKLPHDKICVTHNAVLAFHAAWDLGTNGQAVKNQEATQMLYSMYPSPVRHWINKRGGLRSPNRLIYLQGKELTAMFPPCRPEPKGWY